MMYKVHVAEIYGGDVIVAAADADEAVELVEELCNLDRIRVEEKGFASRTVECVGEPDRADFDHLEIFDKNDVEGFW